MVQPSHLKEIEGRGYDSHAVYRDVLQRLDVTGVDEVHTTMESAISEIHNKKVLLKQLKLTILPVIYITWNGEISE